MDRRNSENKNYALSVAGGSQSLLTNLDNQISTKQHIQGLYYVFWAGSYTVSVCVCSGDRRSRT
jgi:hypothetical protein